MKHDTGFQPAAPPAVQWVIVGVTFLAAVAALLVQQILEPFNAGSHTGLFTNGGDLDVYQHGGLQVLHGQPLYANEIPGGWFTYPPFAAITFIPLAAVNFTTARALWMMMSFTALAATIWRCGTVLGYRPDRRLGLLSIAFALVALDIEAVRGTLWQGQINLVLMAIIVWDLTRPTTSRLRGWSIGVAAGIKLTAIVFVPYLLVSRQWRAAITATATATGSVLLIWCILPTDTADYWLHAVFQTDHIGPLTHPGNHSFAGILATLWAPAPLPTAWWLITVGCAGILGFYACYRAELARHRLSAITITGLLSCVLPPLAWGHHWVWQVPLLAVTLDRVVRSTGVTRWVWAVCAAAVYLTGFMWFSAWLYRTSHSLNPHYPTYVAAWDAAIDRMTTTDKLLVVANHPALFVAAAAATIALAGKISSTRRRRLAAC
ncbi:glycosyltransferase 87 family protein [Mycobacterium haemophilum]|uniref:glycosyltransferase 87 family protein n=1 Tax=Mycobacterium haemophilum TaxID=29311 RepID=UPI00069BA122|nr:glycosyltransferase 87 family protein [Mycobacterium haemophilum]